MVYSIDMLVNSIVIAIAGGQFGFNRIAFEDMGLLDIFQTPRLDHIRYY